jgi:hypothetical protein
VARTIIVPAPDEVVTIAAWVRLEVAAVEVTKVTKPELEIWLPETENPVDRETAIRV